MRLDKFSNADLVDKRPKLELDVPVLRDGRWLVSGKMIVDIVPDHPSPPGHPPQAGLHLELAFTEATDERDAVRQASERLERMGAQISGIAAALIEGEREG